MVALFIRAHLRLPIAPNTQIIGVMPYDPQKHHRRSIRLKEYDYAQPGLYYVTICTQNRQCVFGTVQDGLLRLSAAGELVASLWQDLSAHYPGVALDEYVLMPNHLHGIILLEAVEAGQSMSLSDVVQRFKSLTTRRYADHVKQDGWEPFPGRLWQRNYYEHIIRNERALNAIRAYITGNPANWSQDQYYEG